VRLELDERFALEASLGGWDLVDGDKIHYCRTPADALRYVTEVLLTEDSSRGLREISDALSRIEDKIGEMVEVINLANVAVDVTRAVARMRDCADDKSMILSAALSLASCEESALRVRADRHRIMNLARIVVGAWKRALETK